MNNTPPDGPTNEEIEDQRQLHIDKQIESFGPNSVRKADGETFQEYVSRVIGDKGEAAWDGWNSEQKIQFLAENLSQLTLSMHKANETIEMLIQASNQMVRDVHTLKTNRFGVPRTKPN